MVVMKLLPVVVVDMKLPVVVVPVEQEPLLSGELQVDLVDLVVLDYLL